MQLTTDPESAVWRAAVEELGRLGTQPAVRALCCLLGAESGELDASARWELYKLSDSGLREAVVRGALHVLGSRHPRERAAALTVLVQAKHGDSALLRRVGLELLRVREWRVQRQAIEALGVVGEPDDGNALLPFLDITSDSIRYYAALAIARLRPAAALAPLLARAVAQGDDISWNVIHALSGFATSEVLELLVGLLDLPESELEPTIAELLPLPQPAPAQLEVVLEGGTDCGGNMWWTARSIDGLDIPPHEGVDNDYLPFLNYFGAFGWEVVALSIPAWVDSHSEGRVVTLGQTCAPSAPRWSYVAVRVSAEDDTLYVSDISGYGLSPGCISWGDFYLLAQARGWRVAQEHAGTTPPALDGDVVLKRSEGAVSGF